MFLKCIPMMTDQYISAGKHCFRLNWICVGKQHDHFFNTENPEWIISLIWAIVCHYTDKKTHFSHIFESFCPCTDPLWLKWVKWFTRVLQWTRFCTGISQCWSESGLVSPAVSPSPQGQSPSPSPSPSGQSPSPSGVSPSPLDQSPSPSPLDQSPSPSPSPVGQSPSPSPRVQQKSEWVRTQPGLMSPTIEKCLLLIIFAEPCIGNW